MSYFDNSLGFLLAQTSRKMSYLLSQRLKEYDITPEQWSVLCGLREKYKITQKDIAAHTAKDQPTTARILDILHKKGLIEKKMSATDRRAFLVYITEKGKELTDKTIPIEKRMIEEVISGVDTEHVQLVKSILLRMNDNINNITTS